MVIRIVISFLLLPLFLAVLILLPPIYSVILFALMAALAAYELLWGTGLVKKIRLIIYSAFMAMGMVFFNYFAVDTIWIVTAVFSYVVLLFAEVMISKMEISFDKIAICLTGALVIPFLFSSLVRLLAMENGKFYVLIPFLLSFVSDSGAYFAGVFLGKHKLAPQISPKKTVEGMIGGIVAAVVGVVIFCLVLKYFFGFTVNYSAIIVYGIVGSCVCVFGDLCFSVIKRQTGIKDYGNLIPGHGGILDRFDSTIFVAPVVELLITLWPVLERTV